MDAMAEMGGRMILTTDHGTVRVDHPVEVRGDRETNNNLRYKVGKNLGYDANEVMELRDPDKAGLPKPNVSSSYILEKAKTFWCTRTMPQSIPRHSVIPFSTEA